MKFKIPARQFQKLRKRQNSPTPQKSEVSEKSLRKTFSQCSDVFFTSMKIQQNMVTLVYCTGLIDKDLMNKIVPERLEDFYKSAFNPLNIASFNALKLPDVKPIKDLEDAENEIFFGKLLIVCQQSKEVLSVDIAKRPQRNTEESSIEISVKGPRDNFIEDVVINHALIRKRMRTTSLLSESFEIGRRTKTKVFLLYIKDITSTEKVDQMRKKLQAIDIDGLYSGSQIEGLVNDNPYSVFPRHAYTGRPDFAVQSLLKGRFLLLIDGVAYAYIAPVNLFFLLKAAEDDDTHYFFNAFQRLMRTLGISVAAFLPGFWVALTSFHQNQLPFTFLATVIESRRGVPFPTSLEAMLMLLLFEVFREAGQRLPLAVGQTLSVIGGLIIGDAAIRAGLTSPAMLVVIAGSTIATFTLVNQTLVGVISLTRFFVIIFASTLGFFGFFVSVFIVGIYIAKIQSFGVPYLQIAQRLSFRNTLKAVLRIPIKKDNTRPSSTQPQDKTSKGDNT